MTTRNPSTPTPFARYERELARDAASRRKWLAAAWHWFVSLEVGEILTWRRVKVLLFIVAALNILMFLSGCTPRKPTQQTQGAALVQGGHSLPTPTPQQIGAPIVQAQPQPTQPAQVIEVTRIVEVAQPTQPARVVEVTRVVEVVTTPTPDIQGFSAPAVSGIPGIDESAQPCPVIYWRKGRCIATDAQLDAYASETQP